MRRVSWKRAKLNGEVAQWRDEFRQKISRCELCLKAISPEHLDVHEVVPAYWRAKALDKPFACMCLERRCHNIMELLTIPNQLAYFLRAAPDRFNLAAYWKLCQRRWPDLDTILAFKEKL